MKAAVGSTGRMWTSAIFAVMMMAVGAGAEMRYDDIGAPGNESNVWAVLEDNGTLTVSGSGDMADYAQYQNSPLWRGANITDVIIGDGVTSIGDWAFGDLFSLTSVTIGDDVETIGDYAFRSCMSLTSMTIGEGVKTIGESAFESSGLTSVTIPGRVESIGNYAFWYCSDLTSVTIGDGVETIGESAFWYCSDLTSVTIGDGVETIGESAFESSGLTSVTIPGSVTSIGDKAFRSCSDLTSVTIGDGVKTIGESAFQSSGLTSVTIPNSVESIGNYAFGYCTMESFTSLAVDPPTLGNSVFGFVHTLYVPHAVREDYRNNAAWSGAFFPGYERILSIFKVDFVWDAPGSNYFGSNSVDSQFVYQTYNSVSLAGDQFIPPVEPADNDGYWFAGWYKDENYTQPWNPDPGCDHMPMNPVCNDGTVFDAVTEDITLYGKWNPILYTLTVSAGADGVLSGSSTVSGDYPAGYSVSVEARGNGGYHFVNWTAAGVTLTDDEANPAEFYMPAGNVTLTANFAPDAVPTAVTFSDLTANGESGAVTTTQLTLTFDADPTTLAAGDINVTGAAKGALSGTGLTRTLAISGITVDDGDDITVEIANPAGFDITPSSKTVAVNVYVPPVPPTVTEVKVTPATVSVQKGSARTFAANVVGTNSPSQAVEWSVSGKNAAGTTINAAGRLSIAAGETAARLTVKATSSLDPTKSGTATVTVTSGSSEDDDEPETYTIKFNANGGAVSPASRTTNTSGKVSLPTPEREGYTFEGWYTKTTGGSEVTKNTVFDDDATIYARWTIISYKVTFSAGANGVITAEVGGKDIKTGAEVEYGKSVVFIAEPANGYQVTGWKLGSKTVSGNKTETYTVGEVKEAVTVTVSFGKTDAILTPDRVIPTAKPDEEATVVAPVSQLSGEFTAGPNPVAKQAGNVGFFRQGKRIASGELRIYDAVGNLVSKVKIVDKALGSQARRQVGSWDLADSKGKPVSEGTYLVKGVLKTSDGKKEKVSVILGVR